MLLSHNSRIKCELVRKAIFPDKIAYVVNLDNLHRSLAKGVNFSDATCFKIL